MTTPRCLRFAPAVLFVAGLLLAGDRALADAPDGKALYGSKCAMCHGTDGVAKEAWAKKGLRNLNDPAVQKELTDAQIGKITSEGVPDKKMPAYKDKLTPEEIRAIVAHIRSLAPKS